MKNLQNDSLKNPNDFYLVCKFYNLDRDDKCQESFDIKKITAEFLNNMEENFKAV